MKANHLVGGNSGYVGYSMSKRAAEAQENGRYPKTTFKKVYGVTDKALQALVSCGFINATEWHHTSKFGNKTAFYGWEDPWMPKAYEANKKEIDRRSRMADFDEFKISDIRDIMINSQEFASYEEQVKELRKKAERFNALFDEYKSEAKSVPAEIETSSGAVVHTDGQESWTYWYVMFGGVRLTKRNGKAMRDAAIEEAQSMIVQRMGLEEWLAQRGENLKDLIP